MRYIALIIFVMLVAACDGCKSKGIYWKLDGEQHTFIWGPVK